MQEAITRLLHVRRAALARDDLALVRECTLELLRYGVDVPPIPLAFEQEHTIPAPPPEAAVHRRRERPRSKG